jgi:ATP-dependent RNA helicase DeaD
MLNFGFREEIEDIWKLTPAKKQVLLFSATIPTSIMEMVKTYMPEYEHIKIAAKAITNDNITQKLYCIPASQKFEALCRVMEMADDFYAIVFCRTKIETDLVASQLMAHHFHAEAIHGDIDQSQREKVLARFKQGKTRILVATDVAARGIDVENLSFVVNYSLPENYEIYTHRIGRTGRAGKQGTSLTFATPSDIHRIRFFEHKLGITMERAKLPQAEEIIEKKQLHLLQSVHEQLKDQTNTSISNLTKHLLKLGTPEEIIGALLSVEYGEAFSPESYTVLSDSFPEERRGSSSRSSSRPRHRSDDQRDRGRKNQFFAKKRKDGRR